MAFTVVIAGGGTGGHLYPGIAVAREILKRDAQAAVSFAGTSRGLETRIVPREGFDLDLIRAAGLKGKSIAARLRGAMLIPAGFLDAWRLISRRRPDIVIGVGGYSSGPVVMAAVVRRIPTLVLEQNAVPGLTNRLLAPWVRAAAVNYAQTLSFFGRRGFVTGNPVRKEFFDSQVRNPNSRRVLVLGGSQGAHAINMAMVAAAPRLVGGIPGLEVVHQTGERDVAAVREGYERGGVSARTEPFFDAVAREMNAADLVICRAGATTLAELAASGKPAVLIPFPAATDDHQKKNAQVLARSGAAELIEEKSLSPEILSAAAIAILSQDAKRRSMSEAMKSFARPDAAVRIADRVFALAGRTKGAQS